MAVTTTGSLVKGAADGLAEHLKNGGNFPSVYYVAGNPDGVLTANNGSDIAVDPLNEMYYMAEFAGGSTWYSLGSTT
jgi:hypothetical protein